MSISTSGSAQTSAIQTSAIQPYRPPPPNWVKDAGSPSSSGSGAGGTQGSGGSNPFAKLATDLQSALTALQSGGKIATSASTPSSTDTLAQLQGDLQSLITKFQNDGTGQADGATKASSGHHHHHAKDTDTQQASTTAATSASTAATPTGEPQSQTFVADILKAFQANFLGGGGSKTATTQAGLGIAA
jgi:hypothetical protein